MADYPGFMIYLDAWKPLLSTGDATLAKLLRAAIAYAETGQQPELKGKTAVLWEMVRPKLDRDRQKYGNIRLRNIYGNYCQIADRKGEPRLSFEDWKQLGSHFSNLDPNTNTDTDTDINPNRNTDPDTDTKTKTKTSVSVNTDTDTDTDTDADADTITAPDPNTEGDGRAEKTPGAEGSCRPRAGTGERQRPGGERLCGGAPPGLTGANALPRKSMI